MKQQASRWMLGFCLACYSIWAAEQKVSLSLTIAPNSDVFDSPTNIVIVCQLKNEGDSPVKIKSPYYSSDDWIVNGCYGSMPVPAREDRPREFRKLESKASFRFERHLKYNDENQLFLHTLNGKTIRDKNELHVSTGPSSMGGKPAFDSQKEYHIYLELDGRELIGVPGAIRSNETIVKIR